MKKIVLLILFLLCISPASATILDNIVSFWPMDGNSSDYYGAYNGTDYTITYQTGKIGEAAYCDGTNSRIHLGDTNETNNFTYTLWFKTDGVPPNTNNILFSRWPGNDNERRAFRYAIGAYDLTVYSAAGTWLSVANTAAGAWHFLVYKQEGNNLKVYLDNTLEVNTANTVANPTANTTLCDYTTTGSRFKGWVDEVTLWERGLNDTEISFLYGSGYGVPYPFQGQALEVNVFNFTDKNAVNTSNTTLSLFGENVDYEETNDDGTFYISPILSGNYDVLLENPFYDDTNLYLTVLNSTNYELNVYLETGTSSRSFIIQDSFGVSISGALVSFYRNVNGTYITAAQRISDFSGRTVVNLQPDINYRMIVTASGYDTFTGNVLPSQDEYTVTLTETGISPFSTIYDYVYFTGNYSENETRLLANFVITSTLSNFEYFGVSTTYNSVLYSQNSTSSPSGGEVILNVTPLAYDNQTLITFTYWFKVSGESVYTWNDTYNLNPYNVTNITFTGGLFDGITGLASSSPIRGVLGGLIVLLFIVIFGGASRSGLVSLLGGTLGLGINWYFSLWPTSLIIVSLIVAMVLAVVDGSGGGS